MKLVVAREKLLELIDYADAVIERRNTIPILSHLVLIAKANTLTVMASDLDMVVRNSLSDVTIESEGSIAVPAGTFTAIVRKLPSDKQITLEAAEGRISVRAGRSGFKLPTLSADQLPLIDRPKTEEISLSTGDFNRALKMIRNSMSSEESRYYLNGACLTIESGSLLAVATDGHRLSIARIAEMNIEHENSIVPRKAVGQLIKILDHFEGSVSIRIDTGKIDFQLGELIITSKLIDGTFPDYKRVIPTETTIDIMVCPKALALAIDRVSVVSQEKTKGIKLIAESGIIRLEMTSPDLGTAQEEVSANVSAPITIGYNGRYLKEILDNYSDYETVWIGMSDPSSPAIISPPGRDAEKSVLMPLRL